MLTLRQLLDKKGHQVWSVKSGSTVFGALRMMAEKGIGALPVVDQSNLVGVVSERDYARKVILEGRSSKDTLVAAIMTSEVIQLSLEYTVQDAMGPMTDKRIRHLPVVDNGAISGIVSIGDLVKQIIEEQAFVIDQLESYISGELA
jgi:CBS domain-containing protein